MVVNVTKPRILMYLHLLLEVCLVMTNPTSHEKEISWEEETDDISATKYSSEMDYSYDWTEDIESSGLSSYYEDTFLLVESCPALCTCIVNTIVYCSRQGIGYIGNGLNESITETKILSGNLPESTLSLHLGYNNLTVLPPKVLQTISEEGESSIENLYLQSNQINMVDPNAFVNIPNLKSLDLSFNFISRLVQPCMENMAASDNEKLSCTSGTKEDLFLRSVSDSLLSLNLNQNIIKGIPNYSFSFLKNLEVLRLNWNQITWISKRAFYGLHKLKVLQLRGNPLGPKTTAKLGDILQHFVTGDTPAGNKESSPPGLDDINFYVNGNSVNNIASRRVKRHSSDGQDLRTIFLNSLENLDLGATNLRAFPSIIPRSLQRLYFDNNKISSIPEKILMDLPRLEILQLGGNRIARVKDNVFTFLTNLEVLDLSRNNLTKLTASAFNGLMQLRSLRLNGNEKLSKLARKVFWALPSLRLLYLHDCGLNTLPPGPWIFRIFSFWLYGNPIECNCQTLISLLVRLNHPVNHRYTLHMDPYRSTMGDDSDTWAYQRPDKTLCASPDNFRGYRVEDVRIRDMRCTDVETYNLEISRRIANRYVNMDYQQDASSNEQKKEHKIVERDEENMYDQYGEIVFTKKDDTSDIIEDADKISQELLKTENYLKKSIMSDLNDLKPLNINVSANIEVRKINNAESEEQSLEGIVDTFGALKSEHKELPYDLGSFTETLTNDPSNQKQASESGENTGREWLITLPVSAKDSFGILGNPEESVSSGHFQKKAHEYERKTLLDNIHSDFSSIYTGDSTVGTDKAKESSDFSSWGDLDDNWKEYPQGFANFRTYDDGEAEYNVSEKLEYRNEIEHTMNASANSRLNELIAGYKPYDSYYEYYGNPESSGQEDYGDAYFDLELALQVKDLAKNGTSLDDIIGNLTAIYNVTNYDTENSLSNGHIMDYEDL